VLTEQNEEKAMLNPELALIGGRRWLSTSTEHGSFDQIELKGTEKCLLMRQTNFILGIYETSPYWPEVPMPIVFRPIGRILSEVHTSLKLLRYHSSTLCFMP
jgi:hypothetical protein